MIIISCDTRCGQSLLLTWSDLGTCRTGSSSGVQSCLANQVIRLYLQEACDHVFVDLHDDPQIVEIAVVGRCKDGDQLSASEELEPILLDLVRPADQVQVVLLVEVLDYYLPKSVRHTSIVLAPVNHVLFRVCRVTPQQVAEQAAVWDISGSQDFVNLLQIVEFWRQAAVNAENFVVHDGCHWETVEALDELLPKFKAVASLAFVVESVNSVDGPALVVASQQEEVLRVLDLVGKHQADNLQVLLASVDIVAQEEVVGLRWEVANLEDSE